MQSLVVVTVLVSAIDNVVAFWSASISLFLLGSQASGAERDMVGPKDLPVGEQFKQVVLLQDEDGISLLRRLAEDWKTCERRAVKKHSQRSHAGCASSVFISGNHGL